MMKRTTKISEDEEEEKIEENQTPLKPSLEEEVVK